MSNTAAATSVALQLGTSIRGLRKAVGMSTLELANACQSDVGNISRIERGKQWPNAAMLERIADALGVSASVFFAATRRAQQMEEPANEYTANRPAPVPLISSVSAGKWLDNSRDLDYITDWIECPIRHSQNCFALVVKGSSMHNPHGSPSFQDGDVIYVDPAKSAENKSLVVAIQTDSNESTFKRLLIEGTQMMLEALNPAWPERIIKVSSETRICGTVIGKLERYI